MLLFGMGEMENQVPFLKEAMGTTLESAVMEAKMAVLLGKTAVMTLTQAATAV
jgi:hypothetical protein